MDFNIKQIKDLATNYITFERGLDYYEQGLVQDYSNKQTAVEEQIDAIVSGSHDQSYPVHITIDANHYLRGSCTCEASKTYPKSCKHVIATLLYAYYNKEPHHAKLDTIETDKTALKMISSYTNLGVKSMIVDTFQKKVTLQPFIDFDYRNNASIHFSIGYDKQYVIRNLTEFYYHLKEESIVEYGKNLTLVHHLSIFNDRSRQLTEFFMNNYSNLLFYSSHMGLSYDKKSFNLSPQLFDLFFDLFVEDEVELTIGGKETMTHFVNHAPEFLLSIKEHSESTYKVQLELPKYILIKGQMVDYLWIKDQLYKLDEQSKSKLGILLKAMNDTSNQMIIHKEDMRSFCTNVVNEIKDYVTLDAKEELLNQFGAIPLVAKLYLDLPNEELATGQLRFTYQDEEYFELEQNLNTYRNVKQELMIQNIVSRYFESFDKDKLLYLCQENESIYRLYVEGLDLLSQHMQIFATDAFKNIFRKAPNIHLGVRVTNQFLSIDIDTSDFPMDELYDVLASYNHQKKYHRLKDGTFVNFEENTLSELSQLADVLDISKQDLEKGNLMVPKYRALYIDQVIKTSEAIDFDKDQDFKQMIRDIKDVENSYFEVPNALQSILRNYQKTGFRWLKTMSYYGFGGILADDMGLGKTIEMISLFQSYLEEAGEHYPILVVSPASLVLNWEMELHHFAPQIHVIPIIGNQEQRKSLIDNIPNYQVILTSYDYIKRDIDLYEPYRFMYHVIDEAQYIKNHNTLNAKSVKQIKSVCRFALTGTPIENRLAELWSIFDFIMPNYLYHYKKFMDKFEIPIVKNENKQALGQLKKCVTPFVLRRLKKEVLKELPDKTETTMYAALEGEQKKLYLANLLSMKHELSNKIEENGFKQSKFIVLAMLTRLRQICCDPSLYYDDYQGESVKLEMAMDLIQSSVQAGHKILLFSQFTTMLALIADELTKNEIPYYVLEGKTPKEERLRLVDTFNQDETPVFLISLKAGGTGLNLTSADIVIHYDPWWNISAQNQATDRTHRIGQKEHVQVYKLIAKDTIEEKILKLQEHKLLLADSIIVEDDGIISQMNQDDIMDLFTE